MWRAIWADLDPGLELEAREVEVLRLACRQADLAADLEGVLDAEGLTSSGSRGQPRLSQAVAALQAARALEAKLLAQLDLEGADAVTKTAAGGRSNTSSRAAAAAQARWRRSRGSTAA